MATSAERAASASEVDRSRLDNRTLLAAFVAICVAQIIMAIPTVLNGLFQDDLGPSSTQLLWITAAFQLPVTILELSVGVFGDLFGRKRLLVGGSLLAAVGLLVSSLTPGPGTATGARLTVLWTGEVLTGIGVAALIPTTLAMVAAGTHSARERSRALTIWSVGLLAGGVIGPAIGGWLANYSFGSDVNSGWKWAFLVCAALAVVSALVGLLATDSKDPVGRSLDVSGQVLIALALFGLIFAVVQGPSSGWGSPEVIIGFGAAAVLLVAFVLVELRQKAPLLEVRIFGHPPFAVAMVANVLGMFAYLGVGYSTSIRLSAVQGFSPLRTSLAFVIFNVMGIVLYPVLHKALKSYNPRWVLGAGLVLIAVGAFWLAAIPITTVSVGAVLAPLVVAGAGVAFSVSSVAAVTVNTVPRRMIGMASGANSMLRDLGFTLAPSVLGAIALSRAATTIYDKVDASPTLQHALDGFYGSAAHAPAGQRQSIEAAIGAVKSGPLGANGVPATVPGADGQSVPFNPLHDVAFHALGSAYSLSYLIAGLAALVAGLLVLLVIRGTAAQEAEDAELHPASL